MANEVLVSFTLPQFPPTTVSFTTGQTVVHPIHGPVRVSEMSTRPLRGTPTPYVELDAGPDLRIAVPVPNISEVGLRPVISAHLVRHVLDLLSGPGLPRENSWSRRIKDYRMRLASGELAERAVVARELIRSHGIRPPVGAERELLREAMGALVLELTLALSVTPQEATSLVHDRSTLLTPGGTVDARSRGRRPAGNPALSAA